jgi:hypothetical protein
MTAPTQAAGDCPLATTRVTGCLIVLILILLLPSCATGSPPATATATADGPQSLTGVEALDLIIAAAMTNDVAEIRPFLAFVQSRCTRSEGLGGPPRCRDNEPAGTPVTVFPFLGPEGHFLRQDELEGWQGMDVSSMHAVYEVSGAAFRDENYPAGDYAIVFLSDPDAMTLVTLQVRQERVVRIDFSFGDPPQIRPEDVARYLVAPASPTSMPGGPP